MNWKNRFFEYMSRGVEIWYNRVKEVKYDEYKSKERRSGQSIKGC